jgi:hypothetical protein
MGLYWIPATQRLRGGMTGKGPEDFEIVRSALENHFASQSI